MSDSRVAWIGLGNIGRVSNQSIPQSYLPIYSGNILNPADTTTSSKQTN